MDDATLFRLWYMYLGIAAVVVILAALLLLMVILTARRIERLAHRTWEVAQEIQRNTEAIWALQQTNEVAQQIQETAHQLEAHATAVVSALHEPEESP